MRRLIPIALLCFTTSCVHAQGSWSVPASGTGTIGPASGSVAPPCTINSVTLPGGTVGVVYTPVQLTASNCVAPLVWSVSVGSLPTGLSLSSGGLISGTPSGAGVSAFTVTLLDNAGNAPTFPLTASIASNTIPGSPLQPDSALTSWDTSIAGTPNSNITDCVGTPVNASILPGGKCASSFAGTTAGFQSALNAAACGHVINVAAFSGGVAIAYGPQVIPDLNCDASHYVWLTHDLSDTIFPPEGTRIDPSYIGIAQSVMPWYPYPGASANPNARHMPQILVHAVNGGSCFTISTPTAGVNTPSFSYWRIMGFDCTRDQSTDVVTSLIDMNYQPGQTTTPTHPSQDCGLSGTGATALPAQPALCKADQPNHIIWDRNVVHGDASRQTTRAFSLGGGTFLAFINNYVYDIQSSISGSSGDSQSWAGGFGHGYTGPGFWLFQNNFSASSTEGSLYCGAFTEAKSPVTNADGIPTNVIWNHDWFFKPIAWDTQRGQTLNESIVNEGVTYPQASDQEFQVTPSAIEVQQGTSFVLHNTWLNDSGGGWDHMTDANSSGSVTVDGIAYTTVNSANGIIVKTGEHNVGVSPYQIANAITWTYTACSGAGTPIAACTGATTAGTHAIVFNRTVVESRLTIPPSSSIVLGNSRTLTSPVTITVTATAPSNQIALTPSSPDLQIQPSYTDSVGNKRQFCYEMFAVSNFTSVSLAWKVDGVVNGNASAGQVCSIASATSCNAPASNDSTVAYCSGTGLGTHTISVTSAAGTTTSQTINVSMSSPIWPYDLRPFTSKNSWEAKCVNRGLLENSILENAWGSQGVGGGQPGYVLLNQSANQASQTIDGSGASVGYGPQNISDFAVDHVHSLHNGFGFAVAALSAAKGIHRIKYSNILMEDMNTSRWGHGFLKPFFADFLQYSGTGSTTVLSWTSALTPLADNIFFDHITQVGGTTSAPGADSWISIANNNAQFQLGPFGVTNSVFVVPGSTTFNNNNGDIGDCNKASGNGTGNTEAIAFQGTGYTPPKPCNSSYTLARNLLVDNTTNLSNFTTPTIWQTTSAAADLFINNNPNGDGDYHVKAGSQYAAGGAKDASDGLALGADIDGIAASDAAVRWGAANPPTIDFLTVALMPTPSRLSNHMHGTVNGGSDTYSILDTDAGYPAGYPTGIFFWAKHPTGNPWDIEKYDSTYAAYHWITEDGDAVDAQTCINNGFSSCFLDPNAYKRFTSPPIPIIPRNFTYGTTVTIDTPGPNTFIRTTNCELPGTNTNVNLGDVRAVTTGPFLMTWGGTIDSGTGVVGSNGPTFDSVHGVLTFRNDYYYGGTLSSGVFNDKESTFYVPGSGRVAWFFYQLSGGTYVLKQWTINNTLTSGNTTANFPCGAGKPWWP